MSYLVKFQNELNPQGVHQLKRMDVSDGERHSDGNRHGMKTLKSLVLKAFSYQKRLRFFSLGVFYISKSLG